MELNSDIEKLEEKLKNTKENLGNKLGNFKEIYNEVTGLNFLTGKKDKYIN